MPDSSLHTIQIRRWVERIRAGDLSSGEEMLRATAALERGHAQVARAARGSLIGRRG